MLGRNRWNVCLDTKANSKGYHPSADDMRAFEDYVRDFNTRYEGLVGRISVFVVVSGSFPKSSAALTGRANELLSKVGTPLVFVRAEELGAAIERVRPLGHRRGGLNWSQILVPPTFDPKRLEVELRRVARDRIG